MTQQFERNDVSGDYRIKAGGYLPEKGRELRYTSEQHSFRFYILTQGSTPETFTLYVHYAEPDSGQDLSTYEKNREAIENNIRHYFRQFHVTGRKVTPADPAAKVRFTWSFVR